MLDRALTAGAAPDGLFISTNVIWGYRGGDRWLVSHYLPAPRS